MTSQTEMSPAGGFPPDVVAWRFDRLRVAGCAAPLATTLARGSSDLHALLDLIERGCPPELAARIVAPLDEEPSA